MTGSTPGSSSSSTAEEAKTALETAKLRAELLEAESPLAKAKREAENQKAIDEAHQQSAEAQQKQFAALVPDLSKVTPSSLDTKGETALFGPALAQRATAAAGDRVAQDAAGAIADLKASRILITSDTELATSDAVYAEVVSGLDQLISTADELIEDLESLAPETQTFTEEGSPKDTLTVAAGVSATSFFAAPVLGAIAAALPGALSLLSAHRSLSTSATTADSLAAAAAVVGGLGKRDPRPAGIFHDDIRLLPEDGVVREKLKSLGEKRQKLVGLKRKLEEEKSAKNGQLTELKAEIEESVKQLVAAKASKGEALQAKLDGQRGEAAFREEEVGNCAVRTSLIDGTVTTIDKFTASMQTTAPGATRSPFTAAILRQQLHAAEDDAARFTHVLLVKAEPGSAQQLTDDRPLFLKDTFSTIATSSVTYMLLETTGGSLIAGGSVGGKAKVEGTIGSDFSVKAEAVSATG